MTVIHPQILQESRLSTFRVKDPVSAGTHFFGALASVFLTPVLLMKASASGCGYLTQAGFAVYMLSMTLLYSASASYHSFELASPRGNRILKKIDHLSIFILIAGSYTPVCLTVLPAQTGMRLLAGVWGFAAAGILFKLFWVTCPRWVSSIIYTLMGWMCLLCLPDLIRLLPHAAFMWLLAGGIMYSVGAVIYALKTGHFGNPYFGTHELFHCFVLAGSFCHFIFMFRYLTVMC